MRTLGPDDVVYKNRYVWTRFKNEKNKRKHHIGFETACLVFDDPFYTEVFDEDNSVFEERFNVTGSVTGLINNALITVSVVYRGDLIRIFSARDADITEAKEYYAQLEQYLGKDED